MWQEIITFSIIGIAIIVIFYRLFKKFGKSERGVEKCAGEQQEYSSKCNDCLIDCPVKEAYKKAKQ